MNSPVWRPFTQHGLGEPVPRVVAAEGAVLWTDDGRRIVDAISSWWVTTHGHRHPRIMAAIAEQTERLDQIIFAGWTHEPAEQLASELVSILPEPLTRIFYSDSGSTSVEVALKMALGYWVNIGRPRHRIAVLESGYHGDTVGGMSIGARGPFNRSYERLLFDVETLPFPSAGAEQDMFDRLDRIGRTGELAALIVEPLLLGAGGMRLYAPSVLAEMRAICTRYGVLLIADEVMTGWGRTGTLFACNQAQVAPDIMCLSKGLTGGSLPLAVTAATEAIFDAHLSSDRAKMLFHSSSYTANPIACAAGLANLGIWRDELVQERISTLAARQAERLERLSGHPKILNRRRLGTVTAMELWEPGGSYMSTLGPQLLAFFRERDLLLRPLGNSVYVMPPFCISESDLDSIYCAILDAADSLDRE